MKKVGKVGGKKMEVRFMKATLGEKQYCSQCHQEIKGLEPTTITPGYSHVSACCKSIPYFTTKQKGGE